MQRAAQTESIKLIRPHGGILINRIVEGSLHEQLLEELPRMKTVQLDHKGETDIEMIAVGAFSPLKGFMKKERL